MQLISFKPKFLTLAVIAITFSATGCTTSAQEQATNAASPSADTVGNTDHGMMNHNLKPRMEMDLGAADANYDLRFIDAMSMHHQGAVAMAKEALEKSTRPEIKQLANNIIQAQNKELNQMKQWRKAWYNK